MNVLASFFEPVSAAIIKKTQKKKGNIGNSIAINYKKFPDKKSIDVAIIGLGKNADLIRPHLYNYAYRWHGINVADFGTLRHNGTIKNINDGLTECIIALREKNIIPLFIGERNNYAPGLLKGIDYKKIDYALVTAKLDLQEVNYLSLLKQKNKIFHASIIGVQNYMICEEEYFELTSNFVEYLRLGNLRHNIQLAEPLLRQADVFEFDCESLKHSEFTVTDAKLPSGINNQEACAICRYAGISNTLQYYIINNLQLLSTSITENQQVAQMVWHILDGIENRFNDNPVLKHPNFTVYKCQSMKEMDMLFVKSNVTERWWMQVPLKNKKAPPKFIGCNEADFDIAQQNDVPEKWYRAMGAQL